MIHQVHLKETGPFVVPVGIGANRDLRFEQRARFGQAAPMPQPLWVADAQAVHGGGAHLLQVGVDCVAHGQEAIGAQRRQGRIQRGAQALRANLVE
jgi:hypothetical protein